MCVMGVVLTREQVREVDRIAIEKFGICGLVLMENAGRNAADLILRQIEASADTPVRRVAVFCGTGNNGGDGFVIARHLVNAGVKVQIALAGDADRLTPDAAANHRICRAMNIPIAPAESVEIGPDDLVVDALLGTGFAGQVRQHPANLIHRINAAAKRGVVAIDVPSGLDCNTGEPSNATIVADTTITFVASKTGFQSAGARRFVGRLHVADIGAPTVITDRVQPS
jgi:NAD(P)H-hydrate epimerase